MSRRLKRFGYWLGTIVLLILIHYFLFPFGIFRFPGVPNCGPEQWYRFRLMIDDKEDFIAFLKAHELELFSGSHTPHLGPYPEDWTVSRLNVVVDWQQIARQTQVKNRLFYKIYILTYSHPLCSPQTYTLMVTSYGFGSLMGCCGV